MAAVQRVPCRQRDVEGPPEHEQANQTSGAAMSYKTILVNVDATPQSGERSRAVRRHIPFPSEWRRTAAIARGAGGASAGSVVNQLQPPGAGGGGHQQLRTTKCSPSQ